MPVVIDSTVGGASSNSFVTLAEAQTYMDSRNDVATWTAATTDVQNRALTSATRDLSARIWQGQKASTGQALNWPRSFVVDPDVPWMAWNYYSSTIIPQRVKDATCELAFLMVDGDADDIDAPDDTLNVRRKTVDVLTTEYFDPGMRTKGLSRLTSVMRFIRPLLVNSGLNVPTVHG